jgi:hypothetical protein
MGVFNSLARYTISVTDTSGRRVRPDNRYFLNSSGKRFLEKYRKAFDKKIDESLSFERGLDPKQAMGTGMPLSKLIKPGDILYYKGGRGNIPAKYIQIRQIDDKPTDQYQEFVITYKSWDLDKKPIDEKSFIWTITKDFLDNNFLLANNVKLE